MYVYREREREREREFVRKRMTERFTLFVHYTAFVKVVRCTPTSMSGASPLL